MGRTTRMGHGTRDPRMASSSTRAEAGLELRCFPSDDTEFARTASAALDAVVIAERTDEPVNVVLGAAEQRLRTEYPNVSLRRRDPLASLGMSAALLVYAFRDGRLGAA
jgi:hypothetical protein